MAIIWDYPGEPVPERQNQSGFTGARDSEWQWHQLGYMEICTSPQADYHTSTLPLGFLQAGFPSCCPTNSIKHWRQIHSQKLWPKSNIPLFS